IGLGRSGAADETRCDDQRLVGGKWVAGESVSAVGFSTRARLGAQSADRRATPRRARPRRRRDAMTRAPGLMSLLLVASLTQRGLAGPGAGRGFRCPPAVSHATVVPPPP